MRMADAQQYRRKISIGVSVPRHPTLVEPQGHPSRRAWRHAPHLAMPPLPSPAVGALSEDTTELGGSDTGLWFTQLDDAPVELRLEHAARTVSERAGAVAWSISTLNQVAGTLQEVSVESPAPTRPPMACGPPSSST